MSPVHMDELPAAVQAKILQQIGVDDSLSPTPVLASEMNQVADAVIQGVNDFAKVLPQIVTLREYFDTAERDSANRLRVPIKSCRTWTEFCRTHLGENIRTIQRLLRDVNKKPKLESAEPNESAPMSTDEPPPVNERAAPSFTQHLRDWIEQTCPTVYAHVQGSIYNVQARSNDPNGNDAFDLELRSITESELKAACEAVAKIRISQKQEWESEDTVL